MVSVAAGTIAAAFFIASTIPMLAKAFRTRDLSSYSLGNLALSVIGNGIQWLYVVSLPPGPIYGLHAYYTICTLVMLALSLRYRLRAAQEHARSEAPDVLP